jgi:predicted aspartyl protease
VLSAAGFRTKILGLIDSGSDYVLFPRHIADALGIKLSKKTEEADGIGGRVKCRSGLVSVTVTKGRNSKIIKNMRIRIQEDGSCGIDEILLGRIPFFKYFKIEFNENARRVRLKPVRRSLKE